MSSVTGRATDGQYQTIVKRKQYLWLGIVVVGAASAIGGALYLSDVDMPVTVRRG